MPCKHRIDKDYALPTMTAAGEPGGAGRSPDDGLGLLGSHDLGVEQR